MAVIFTKKKKIFFKKHRNRTSGANRKSKMLDKILNIPVNSLNAIDYML